MLYVYGIVRAGHRLPTGTSGLASAPVRLVESGPLAAAVSDVEDAESVTDDGARAHLRALTRVLDGGPVLPVRLGTVEADEEAVRTSVLDPSRELFVEQLTSLDGLVELHVDVDDDEASALAELAPRYAAVGTGGDLADRIETGHLIAVALVEQRRAQADAIIARLRPLSVDDVPRSQLRGPEDPVLRWAFLVRRDELPSFDDAVAGVRAEHGALHFRYIGPLPAAHFLERRAVAAKEPADTFRGSGSWGW